MNRCCDKTGSNWSVLNSHSSKERCIEENSKSADLSRRMIHTSAATDYSCRGHKNRTTSVIGCIHRGSSCHGLATNIRDSIVSHLGSHRSDCWPGVPDPLGAAHYYSSNAVRRRCAVNLSDHCFQPVRCVHSGLDAMSVHFRAPFLPNAVNSTVSPYDEAYSGRHRYSLADGERSSSQKAARNHHGLPTPSRYYPSAEMLALAEYACCRLHQSAVSHPGAAEHCARSRHDR